MAKKSKEFSTVQASIDLIFAMEDAIKNMTAEVRKQPDQDLTGAARKSELQAIKETALACKELIVERQKLMQMIEELETTGGLDSKEKDFKSGFAEKFAANK
jgi:hypothetical protein